MSSTFMNGLLNNPDSGGFFNRMAVTVLDEVSTTLPSTASLTLDGVSLHINDSVLFTHLTNAQLNNRVYKIVRDRSSLVFQFQLRLDGQTTNGAAIVRDCIEIQQGSYAEKLVVFDGASWLPVDLDSQDENAAIQEIETNVDSNIKPAIRANQNYIESMLPNKQMIEQLINQEKDNSAIKEIHKRLDQDLFQFVTKNDLSRLPSLTFEDFQPIITNLVTQQELGIIKSQVSLHSQSIEMAQLRRYEVSLTSDQIKTLFSAPVELLLSDIGSTILIDRIELQLEYPSEEGVPYTLSEGANLVLFYTDSGQEIATITSEGFLDASESKKWLISTINYNNLVSIGESVSIKCLVADPTLGNSSLKIIIKYKLNN